MDTETEKLKIEVSQAEFERIEEAVARTTGEFIKNLPNLIKTRLEGAVAKILGFDNSWGEWKVDHCNGRMSVMSEYISAQARAAAANAVSSINFKMNKDLQKAIDLEFAEQFRDEMRRQLRNYVEQHVKKVLDAAMASGSLEIETVGCMPTKKDVANPNYGKKPMEKLIMETVVASHAKIEEEKK